MSSKSRSMVPANRASASKHQLAPARIENPHFNDHFNTMASKHNNQMQLFDKMSSGMMSGMLMPKGFGSK